MSSLPDLEGLAIFGKVAELRSFAAAAADLKLSKATVSKAVTRLETRLGARLFNRTSRRLALTDAGRALTGRAHAILAEAEAAESEALSQSASPRGLIRLAVPMSFGVLNVAPLIPDFLKAYPEVSIDLHLSDARVDIIGDGFDAAIRIAALPDSSLIARRLCDMPIHLLAAPAYLKARGRPKHPLQLAEHCCLSYAYFATPDTWRFRKTSGEVATGASLGSAARQQWRRDATRADRGHGLWRAAGIHRRRRGARRPARDHAARMAVAARRRGALGHATRRP